MIRNVDIGNLAGGSTAARGNFGIVTVTNQDYAGSSPVASSRQAPVTERSSRSRLIEE
jgi:hypothetical protein